MSLFADVERLIDRFGRQGDSRNMGGVNAV